MLLFAIFLELLLSVVFGAAAVGKLLDRKGTAAAIIKFGASGTIADPLSVLLAIIEIAVALGLFFPITVWASALAALLLLAAFCAAIIFNLIRGRAPDCHCF